MAFINSHNIHPDFYFWDEWYWSQASRKAWAYVEPKFKIQFFFDTAELTLLNECPYVAKFGKNIDSTQPFEFCGFIFPVMDEDRQQLEVWASRFRKASVFAYGSDVGGKWSSGTEIKDLKPSSLKRNS